MKKAIWIILILVLVAIVSTLAVLNMISGEPLRKIVSLDGYEISVPQDWVASSDGTLTDKNGAVAGKYILINEEPTLDDISVYAEEQINGEKEQTDFAQYTKKSVFETSKGKAVQYLIYDLPNPEPYAASILLYLNCVSDKTADEIAKSFTPPVMGNKPPAKHISVPLYDDIGTDKTAKHTIADGSVQVKNISLLDSFIRMQQKNNATGLDVIAYQTDEKGNLLLESWSHIEHFNGQGYMYTYVEQEDGVYSYKNNPVVFQSITKEVLKDKGITAYRLKIGDAETITLLEIPIDLYRDNVDELVAMKTDRATEETVLGILDQILPTQKRAGVTASKKDKEIILNFASGTDLEWKSIFKNAAVIFALSADIETITVQGTDGQRYVIHRDEALSGLETSADEAVKSPENFVKFTEELEKAESEKAEQQGGNSAPSGSVLYSGTVVISANTLVIHPRTGEQVEVGPYAEKKGYGAYLGKPITVTVSKQGRGYIATATCGGSVIASQAYETEAAAQSAIAMIKAYS